MTITLKLRKIKEYHDKYKVSAPLYQDLSGYILLLSKMHLARIIIYKVLGSWNSYLSLILKATRERDRERAQPCWREETTFTSREAKYFYVNYFQFVLLIIQPTGAIPAGAAILLSDKTFYVNISTSQ